MGVGYLVVFNYFLNKLIELKEAKEKDQPLFFQDRLVKLLSRSMEEAKKPEHIPEKLSFQVNLTSFALYSSILPISPVVCLATVMIRYYGLRVGLLYEERRPINKSYELIKFSSQLAYIYFMGVIVVSWANIFSFEFLERNFQGLLELIAKPISEQTIFMFKFAITAIYALLMLLVGYLIAFPIASLSDDTLVGTSLPTQSAASTSIASTSLQRVPSSRQSSGCRRPLPSRQSFAPSTRTSPTTSRSGPRCTRQRRGRTWPDRRCVSIWTDVWQCIIIRQ